MRLSTNEMDAFDRYRHCAITLLLPFSIGFRRFFFISQNEDQFT